MGGNGSGTSDATSSRNQATANNGQAGRVDSNPYVPHGGPYKKG